MSSSPKQSSFLFLSLLCFALADVRDGLGPFFGVFLQGHGWRPDEIGYVMTAGGFAGLICATPLGAFADYTRKKRLMLALSSMIIVAACGFIFFWQGVLSAAFSKILSSAAAAAITPALTGITLGLTGQKGFALRLGINEAWSHAGNAVTALLGGLIGYFHGFLGVFAVLAAMGVASVCCVSRINPLDIDYAIARGLDSSKEDAFPKLTNWSSLFANGPLLVIAVTLFFFHLGNAALLPLLGQSAVAKFAVNPPAYTAGTIILAQTIMILTALWGSREAEKRGFGVLFYLALIALPVRGFIAALWQSPWNILPVQILDGVGAGLLGVATPGLVARILQGSGHINMGIGFVLAIQGIGAALSNSYGGLFAHHIGYSGAFIALGAAPCAGLACFAIGANRLSGLREAI